MYLPILEEALSKQPLPPPPPHGHFSPPRTNAFLLLGLCAIDKPLTFATYSRCSLHKLRSLPDRVQDPGTQEEEDDGGRNRQGLGQVRCLQSTPAQARKTLN